MVSDHTLPDTRPRESRAGSPGGGPSLIVAMECQRPVALPAALTLRGLDEVLIGRGPQRGFRRSGRTLEVQVPDGWMSSRHVRLERRDRHWHASDAGSKNGTFLDGRAVADTMLADGALLEAGRTLLLFRGRGPEGDLVPETPAPLTTLAAGFAAELERLEAIAQTELPVLLLGDTGVGKEVAARALHERSGRPGPLIDVNCGALPESLIESELFGHIKGAFSGADANRLGLVRAAHGGTLLLDEVAELPLPAQATLLRVLQDRRVRPVGGHAATEVDVRVVAATLQDLDERVRDGTFREDLYARLAGTVVRLPPLRERLEDLGLLIAAMLPAMGAPGARFTREAGRSLFAYDWPRNVRELEHALRAALAFAGSDEIDVGHLPEPVRAASAPREPAAPAAEHTIERQLDALLREHGGNVSAVARDLGKAPMQIYRWLRRYGIDVDRYRS